MNLWQHIRGDKQVPLGNWEWGLVKGHMFALSTQSGVLCDLFEGSVLRVRSNNHQISKSNYPRLYTFHFSLYSCRYIALHFLKGSCLSILEDAQVTGTPSAKTSEYGMAEFIAVPTRKQEGDRRS